MLPGTLHGIQFYARFKEANDGSCAILDTSHESIILRFSDPAVVERLLKYHSTNPKWFVVAEIDGRFVLKGCHPKVICDEPPLRPYSDNHAAIEEARRPGVVESEEITELILHATEKLKSASTSSSSRLSSSSKAEVGPVSIKSSVLFNTADEIHMALLEESKANARAMEKLRFGYMGVLTMLNILTRVVPLLGGIEEDFVYLDTEYKKDESLEV